jgi:type VI secretion system protein ImpB
MVETEGSEQQGKPVKESTRAMASESQQKKKGRVRKPRVHIEYEVELNGAMKMKELPFLTGVMADLGGHRQADKKLKDREFVPIDRDNFNSVLKGIAPRLALKVDNKLKKDGGELAVELNFEKLSDFDPASVAQQVAPLRELVEVRKKLVDLKSRTETSDVLDEQLNAILQNTELRDKLKSVLLESGGDAPAAEPEQPTT